MPEENRKNAVVLMHAPRKKTPQEQKTFVCFGVARGGTSAVGGTMQRLGVFMGHDLPNNYEDPDFVRQPAGHMLKTIAKRNEEHACWGWKFPNAANYLDGLLPTLRNPHLVVVFRDLVATMKAHMRWHDRAEMLAAHDVILQQQRNWFLVERWRLPTAMVSYEKAILTPDLFAESLADFMDMPRPEGDAMKDITQFLTPGSYK